MSALMDKVRFEGHHAAEVAELCDLLAASADQGVVSLNETASIARRAAHCIRFMLERIP